MKAALRLGGVRAESTDDETNVAIHGDGGEAFGGAKAPPKPTDDDDGFDDEPDDYAESAEDAGPHAFVATLSIDDDGVGPWTHARTMERALYPGDSFALKVARGDDADHVTASCTVEEGVLIVTISSRRIVVNACDDPLEVRAASFADVIAPNGEAPLPLLGRSDRLFMRRRPAPVGFGDARILDDAWLDGGLARDLDERRVFRVGGLRVACATVASTMTRRTEVVSAEAGIIVADEDHFGGATRRPRASSDASAVGRASFSGLSSFSSGRDSPTAKRDETAATVRAEVRPVVEVTNALPVACAWEFGNDRGILAPGEAASSFCTKKAATLKCRVANYGWSRGLELDLDEMVKAQDSAAKRQAPPEEAVSRTSIRVDALEARVATTPESRTGRDGRPSTGEEWVRVAPSLRVVATVDFSGRAVLGCRVALENALDVPAAYAPGPSASTPGAPRALPVCQGAGYVSGRRRPRPPLSRPSSQRRRGLLASVTEDEDGGGGGPSLPREARDAASIRVVVACASHRARCWRGAASSASDVIKSMGGASDAYVVKDDDDDAFFAGPERRGLEIAFKPHALLCAALRRARS